MVVAGALIYNVLTERQAPTTPTNTPVPLIAPAPIIPRGDLAADEKATIDLFRNVSPAVVHITSIATQRSRFSLNVFDIPQGAGDRICLG